MLARTPIVLLALLSSGLASAAAALTSAPLDPEQGRRPGERFDSPTIFRFGVQR